MMSRIYCTNPQHGELISIFCTVGNLITCSANLIGGKYTSFMLDRCFWTMRFPMQRPRAVDRSVRRSRDYPEPYTISNLSMGLLC